VKECIAIKMAIYMTGSGRKEGSTATEYIHMQMEKVEKGNVIP